MITLPVYLVIDTSASLAGDIDLLNDGLDRLHESSRSDPIAADRMRIALIDFSSTAEEVLRLTEVGRIVSMPSLRAGGGTNYGAAFSLARDIIDRDVAELKAGGKRVFRPLMFFVTDGVPIDGNWRSSLQDLQSPTFRAHPTIIAIGFGAADPGILREIGGGQGRAFMISDALKSRDAVRSLNNMLTEMMLSSLTATITASSDESGLALRIPAAWLDLSRIQDLL